MGSSIFFLRIAGLLGALAVCLGAFGAHALKARLPADLLEIFEVGVRYHFYHTLALLAVAAGAGGLWSSRWAPLACWAWLIGILIFSGSLYLLAFSGLRWLGAITPIGGVAFILGWIFLIIAASSKANG